MPIIDDADFEERLLYCQKKYSFIREAELILTLRFTYEMPEEEKEHNRSSLTSLVNSLGELIGIAEKIIDRLKKR